MVAQHDGVPLPPGVLLCGTVPPLADGYVARADTGPDLASSLPARQTAVLVPGSASVARGDRLLPGRTAE
jgi:hypothetical protein